MPLVPGWILVPAWSKAGAATLAVLTLIAVLAPWLAGIDPSAIAGEALRPPSGQHWFGTDDLGRDLFSGVMHGARTSLVVGLVAAALSVSVALLVGGTAAMRGGAIDQVLMRGTEFVQALPRFFLIILIVSLFGSVHSIIILVIGLTTWPSTARVQKTLFHPPILFELFRLAILHFLLYLPLLLVVFSVNLLQ